jgi:hypothetical protein
VGDDILVDSDALLVTDFVNLKIKPAQSFEGTHRSKVFVCMFIGVSTHTCISIYVYTVFLKKDKLPNNMFKESDSIIKTYIYIGLNCSLKN